MPLFRKQKTQQSNSERNYRIYHKIHRTPPPNACEKGFMCKHNGWHHRSFNAHLVDRKSILQKLGYQTYEYVESL